jgi:flagellar hook-length control protein FliK
MNINLLTIDSNLAATTGTSPFLSPPNANTMDSQFALTLDDKKLQTNNLEKPTTDNIKKEEVQNHKQSLTTSPQELTTLIDKTIQTDNPYKAEHKTNSKEQNAIPDSIKKQNKQSNIIQSWLAEHSVAGEQNKGYTITKTEPKAGKQLTQIITNTQNDRFPSITGHAVKSAQIKLLHTTEKGQLGIKTVLPINSNGQNGLKAISPDTSKSNPAAKKQLETASSNEKVTLSAKAITETKSITEKVNIKEFISKVSGNISENANTTKARPETLNINPTTVQDKTSEKQPQNNKNGLEKSILAAETDAKANKSQNIPNLSNPNNKEPISASNTSLENQSVQKLNIATVQINAGQIKEHGNSASNKSSSKSFEQMLSQNNPQTLITEPPAVPAKNAKITNTMGQSSSSDVSADIGKQILESVQRSISQQGTDRQITVRLNPPELGKVFIRFQQQNAELTGFMEVNKAQTRFEIEQALPQIIRNLADCGIQIKRLEVVLSNEQQSGQGALGNQSLHNGQEQQQYSANPDTSGNDTDIHKSNEWLTSNNSYENLSELQWGLITDGSINLLI